MYILGVERSLHLAPMLALTLTNFIGLEKLPTYHVQHIQPPWASFDSTAHSHAGAASSKRCICECSSSTPVEDQKSRFHPAWGRWDSSAGPLYWARRGFSHCDWYSGCEEWPGCKWFPGPKQRRGDRGIQQLLSVNAQYFTTLWKGGQICRSRICQKHCQCPTIVSDHENHIPRTWHAPSLYCSFSLL